MEFLSYYETLAIVESFMKRSGIRRYCTNVCKGDCCQGCYGSKDACHKNEGRRLSCSSYICHTLQREILTSIRRKKYYKAKECIISKLTTFNRNPYYKRILKRTRTDFEILKKDMEFFLNINIIASINREIAKLGNKSVRKQRKEE